MAEHPQPRSWFWPAFRPLRPRTVRARTTVAVAFVLGVALAAGATVLLAIVRGDLWDTARQAAQQQALTSVELLDRAAAEGAYSIDAAGQVVPLELAGDVPVRPQPTPTVKPDPAQDTPQIAEAVSADGRYRVQSSVDFAAAQDTLDSMLALLIPGVALSVLLGALLTWLAVGRALAPVEAVRREAAEITATDLHRRLPVPSGRDEIASLTSTFNTTLDRLERVVDRLRTFTGDVSHELRSPLTTLRTRLELALARPERTDWPEVAVEALHDTGQLQNLVTDLLLLARLDAAGPTHDRLVDLVDLVQTRTEKPGATPSVEITAPASLPVLGNPAHLTRLLTNLIDNARRHGTATIHVRITTDDTDALVEVVDDGPGIPPEDRDHIFGRFNRLDHARAREDGGTGLGLAIARAIAITHGGTLTAEEPTKPLTGARMVLRIPLPDRHPHTSP